MPSRPSRTKSRKYKCHCSLSVKGNTCLTTDQLYKGRFLTSVFKLALLMGFLSLMGYFLSCNKPAFQSQITRKKIISSNRKYVDPTTNTPILLKGINIGYSIPAMLPPLLTSSYPSTSFFLFPVQDFV